MNDENEALVCLTDEDGSEENYEFLDLIEYEGSEYAILYPIQGEGDTVEILRVEDFSEDEDVYLPVDDDETLNAVFEMFKERNKDEIEFE